MTKNPLTLAYFPFITLFILSLFLGSLPLRARADAPIVRSDGQMTLQLLTSYPYWYQPTIGGPQDALRYGQPTFLAGIVWDEHEVTSISIDLSELGIPAPISYPVYYDAYEHLYPYQYGFTVATHETGTARVRVTATDDRGATLVAEQTVTLDNIPATVRMDSAKFTFSSTSPEASDQLLVSGFLDTDETKLYAYEYHYLLFHADGTTPAGVGNFQRLPDAGFVFTDLGRGTFTDYSVKIEPHEISLHPEAAYLAVRLTMRDGGGNDTVAVSPLIPLSSRMISPPEAAPPDVPPVMSDAVSNVLFLPGIEGSRLYRPAGACSHATSDCVEEKLWDPSGDHDLQDLSLTTTGSSVRTDVYTKEGDTIDAVSIFKFYASFANDMDALRDAGTITDWKPVAYDWRLSLDDILAKGALHGDRIYYEEATNTPYIEQTLRSLAASSKTGKVTIIAHSNGGLVAKALLQKLGDAETSRLVDTLILVGAPQSGAPQALAGLFHGFGTALPADWCATWTAIGSLCSLNASRAQSRSFAENAPMAYHLLPSPSYFDSIQDALHPLVRFTSRNAYAHERNAYGFIVQNEDEMDGFALAQEGGRSKPSLIDLVTPNVLNAGLLAYTHGIHAALDAWAPPASVQAYEIGGWGADTLSGIEYYDRKKSNDPAAGTIPSYRPLFTDEGDATVPIGSALLMQARTNITRYWLDLAELAFAQSSLIPIRHSNLLEASSMRTLIRNLLTHEPEMLPPFVSKAVPSSQDLKDKLQFLLYGPARLHLHDQSGEHTGETADGRIEEAVFGSTYGRLGEVQYILAPVGKPYRLSLAGLSVGEVSLEIDELSEGVIHASTTITGIPISEGAQATLTITNGIGDASSLALDSDGDDITDRTIPLDSLSESAAQEERIPPMTQSEHTDTNSSRSRAEAVRTQEELIPSDSEPVSVPREEVTPESTQVSEADIATITSSVVHDEQVERNTEITVLETKSKKRTNATAAALLPVQDMLYALLKILLEAFASLLNLVPRFWR